MYSIFTILFWRRWEKSKLRITGRHHLMGQQEGFVYYCQRDVRSVWTGKQRGSTTCPVSRSFYVLPVMTHWSALFLHHCFIIRRSCLGLLYLDVKTAREFLSLVLPSSFPDSSKSTFMFLLVLATGFEVPFFLFLPPLSLLLSLPDRKKRRLLQ